MDLFKFTLSFLVLFGSITSFSQNEANNWYFGENAGMDFNDGMVAVLNDGAMDTPAGCSTISDTDGNLLFYTNGQTVWNRKHEIMANGTDLAGDINHVQSSLIVPKPNDPDTYYIFTTRFLSSVNPTQRPGLYYSEVTFSNENPLGAVSIKNTRLIHTSSERLTAIHDAATNSIKVITFGAFPPSAINNTFFIFNVTENGVDRIPKISQHNDLVSIVGALKISPDGKKIALADFTGYFIYLYDFDISNLTMTYDTTINPSMILDPRSPYGLEFSQDSKILYFSVTNQSNIGYLYKYLLNNKMDPANEKILISSSSEINFGSLQLATNGKIYVANYVPGKPAIPFNRIGVINDPENFENPDYESTSISLRNSNSLKGLPNFITSFLRNRIITENKCLNEPLEFITDTYAPLDAILWEFGDGTTSTDFEPAHQYTTSGTYMVKATIYFNNQTNEIFKEVEAYPVPEIAPNETLLQCDTDNDGIILINLNNIEDKVLNYTRDFEFSFFHSYNDAINESNEIVNPENYTTSFDGNNLEEIFVKIITEQGCYTISNFFIEAIYNELTDIPPMYACENSDFKFDNQEGRFDLGVKAEEIRAQFNLPQSSSISFYESSLDAQTKTNALWISHESESTRLWARAETEDNDCAGIGSFDIVVNDAIELDVEKTYTICALEPSILLDGNQNNNAWEWFDGNGTIISTNRTIELTQPGNYSVTVYNTENGLICPLTKNFTVNPSKSVIFDEVISGDNQIYVSVIGDSSYEYSIDGVNYFGNGKAYTFSNVSAGLYTVYVRDINNCESPISTKTYFIGYPRFFSPNGDGYNDTWRIEGISGDFYLSADIYIFDRYGKVLYYMDLASNQEGWNGQFNGQLLSSDDYWFKATLVDIENKTFVKMGHFTLKY
ncbi:T9SS type B sorting domain-containing protein [Confluentibacter citreus]|uniref:T9SS type B sorting domain-containing protein n=1 Tax=Confluentibacter citreus TaxID=2007307 RepID=UPI000C2849AC|nr:T9SS type B sorting domain-containing protein [Confluentibacter citreus]